MFEVKWCHWWIPCCLLCIFTDSFIILSCFFLLSVQIDLMVAGNRPNNAIGFICELQLFWVVFNLPQNSEPAVVEGCDRFITTSKFTCIKFWHHVYIGFLALSTHYIERHALCFLLQVSQAGEGVSKEASGHHFTSNLYFFLFFFFFNICLLQENLI